MICNTYLFNIIYIYTRINACYRKLDTKVIIMEHFKIVLVLLISCASSQYFVKSHTYHFGQCPTLEPMTDFSMERVSLYQRN